MATAKPVTGTLADVGEFELIAQIRARLSQSESVFIGPGDDAAVVRTPRGHVVVSTDLLVEGRHFRREWGTPRDVGHRAAAQNLADIAAMGGRTTALTLGFGAPADLPATWLFEFVDGLVAETESVGASVVGGDLTRANEIVIAVTALGECAAAPVRRSGAQPGDVVAIAGRQGWSAAGLAIVSRGFRSPRALVDAFLRPTPPYDAGPAAAAAGATAMIDVSDGLLADIGHIAEDSGVAIDVRRDAFELAEPFRAVGAALGVDPMTFVLGGGEDHSLVATFPTDTPLPEGFRAIGQVIAGSGVTVDGAAYEGTTGHTHF